MKGYGTKTTKSGGLRATKYKPKGYGQKQDAGSNLRGKNITTGFGSTYMGPKKQNTPDTY